MKVIRKENEYYCGELLITPKKICNSIREGKLVQIFDKDGNDISKETLAEFAFSTKKDIFSKLGELLDREVFETYIESGGVDEYLARKKRGFYAEV